MSAVVGVDVGGTFTDIVIVGDDRVTGRKVPTTRDQSEAVVSAVAGTRARVFLHGTTAATNTLLEERGAEVSLLTDAGYEDLIEIGRQDRPSLYDSSVDRPTPLVPRQRRYSDPADVGDAEIVAVALLDSYLDPEPETTIAAGIEAPVVLSSSVSPEFREYERLATTVMSAYLTPSVADYLASLDNRVDIARRLVMTSSGGLIPFDEAAGLAGRIVLSGPAGGVVAAAALGGHHGFDSVISFDMGGTSTDVCRIIGGSPTVGTGHRVAGRVNRVPSVPIRTIGAGGGSIAWLDAGGALRVGPRSAGAEPGPAVYGWGGSELTVTDANVLAGYIPTDLALGGSVTLNVAAGETAASRLAARAGLPRDRAVSGVLEVVDAHMERALRSVSVEEGADPRESALVAFGGAGGLHAGRLARRLGIRAVLVPPHSGVFSALGLALAAPRSDSSRTVMIPAREVEGLTAAGSAVLAEAEERYQTMFGERGSTIRVSADVRYQGQAHELEVGADDGWQDVEARFHAVHGERFGFDRVGEPVEVVNIRATVSGESPLSWGDLPQIDGQVEPHGVDGVWWRESLPAGFTITGPATIVEDNSATRIEEGDRLTVLDDGTMKMEIAEL